MCTLCIHMYNISGRQSSEISINDVITHSNAILWTHSSLVILFSIDICIALLPDHLRWISKNVWQIAPFCNVVQAAAGHDDSASAAWRHAIDLVQNVETFFQISICLFLSHSRFDVCSLVSLLCFIYWLWKRSQQKFATWVASITQQNSLVNSSFKLVTHATFRKNS